jgi:hypothetical protein
MGNLATYLQKEFINQAYPGWNCSNESRVLSTELEAILGYEPRADVLLSQEDGGRRLWIEFEVSRADPVANHAKFATAHLFQPQLETDVFVSMVSAHVVRGRRNLASNTILLMRLIGMNAFQTVLFPQFNENEIKTLNHLSADELAGKALDIKREIERVLCVSETVTTVLNRRIHFVGDIPDVMLNLIRWNEEVATGQGSELWGKRTVTYFVFDPHSKNFAPSKFCAYVPIPFTEALPQTFPLRAYKLSMTLEVYTNLDGTDTQFDGHRARLHLTKGLAMEQLQQGEDFSVKNHFNIWMEQHSSRINVHPKGPVFLLPPAWFTSLGKKLRK